MTTHPRPLAIVTGASSGIGRCIATSLGHAGYRVALIARRVALLHEVASSLPNPDLHPIVPLDLAEIDDVEPAITALLELEGPASIVVNAAGFGAYATFDAHTPAHHARLMRVNYEAPVAVLHAALPGLLDLAARDHLAHVFNICSCSARIGPWGHAGYAASKGALRSLTEVLACELEPRGVRVTAVYPGIVATPFFSHSDTRRLWKKVHHRAIPPEQVARAVLARVGKPGAALYVPRHYRFIDTLVALSPDLALDIVRRESKPVETTRTHTVLEAYGAGGALAYSPALEHTPFR